jgi:hypothetical protein
MTMLQIDTLVGAEGQQGLGVVLARPRFMKAVRICST